MKKGSAVELEAQLTRGSARIDLREFGGGIKQEMASLPEIRIGKKWWSTAQILTLLVPVGFVLFLTLMAMAQALRALPSVQEFIRIYPGVGDFALPVQSGFPWWLRWQHFFNLFILLFIMRSGLQILADHPRLYLNGDCTPGTEWFRLRGAVPNQGVWTAKQDSVALPHWLGLPGIRHSIGLARWWHASMDTLWVINGFIFYALIFSTDQWQRLVPVSWSLFPHALSTALQYASLDFPEPAGWHQYNALQMTAYFCTVFVAGPLALLTGLLQAPFIAARFKTAKGIFNRQIARTIHFGLLVYFVSFLLAHVAMVFSTGLLQNLNHITRGVDDSSLGGLWMFLVGIGVMAGAWMTASPLTLRHPRLIQHTGHFLTGWLSAIFECVRPVAEFTKDDISPHFWVNGTEPQSGEFQKLRENHFHDFRLKVGGLVENPVEIPFADLKALPRREQITQHYCIQGWSGIAQWAGVPMTEIMRIVRPKAEVRFVVFYSFAHGPSPDEGLYYDVHEIGHMHHTNTILAYEMNGQTLSHLHGAPLRLRNELELGFKQVKWIQAVEFVATFHDLGSGEGGFNEDNEYFDYRAPI